MLAQIKYYLMAAVVALACFGTWYATSDHYEKVIAENQVKSDKKVQDQLVINQQLMAEKAALTKAAEEEHAQNQLVVNSLTSQLGGVRVHIPACRGTVSKAGTLGKDSDRGSGVLSARVDELFADLQARVGQLVQRCDQLNIDAKQVNAASK